MFFFQCVEKFVGLGRGCRSILSQTTRITETRYAGSGRTRIESARVSDAHDQRGARTDAFLSRVTMETEIHSCQTPTPSSCSTAMMSPVMNVVSSPSSSPLLPPLSCMISKTTSPTTIAVPSSPQSQSGTVNNNNNGNKRKSSTPSTNPNRFDGTTEEELAKRLLSDILQPNLDIVFVRSSFVLCVAFDRLSLMHAGWHQSKSLCCSQGSPLRWSRQSLLETPTHVRSHTQCIQCQ